MKLYVCYGTFGPPEKHFCGRAYGALVAAGHRPDVERTYGCFRTDPIFPGRRKVKRLTGNYNVPTLILDDGTIIDGSENILDWAESNRVAMPQSQFEEGGPDGSFLHSQEAH